MFSSAMMYILRVHLFSPGVERMRLLKGKVYKSQFENMRDCFAIFSSPPLTPAFLFRPTQAKSKLS